jgi:hypothetical protein
VRRAGWASLVLLTSCGGHAAPVGVDGPSPLHDDLVGYAMASCLAIQPNDYLKDQGQRWAGAIMQDAHGPVEAWAPVATAVKAELGRSGIARGQGDGPTAAAVPLPVMTCGRIATTPAVRQAIAVAAKALARDYAGMTR